MTILAHEANARCIATFTSLTCRWVQLPMACWELTDRGCLYTGFWKDPALKTYGKLQSTAKFLAGIINIYVYIHIFFVADPKLHYFASASSFDWTLSARFRNCSYTLICFWAAKVSRAKTGRPLADDGVKGRFRPSSSPVFTVGVARYSQFNWTAGIRLDGL